MLTAHRGLAWHNHQALLRRGDIEHFVLHESGGVHRVFVHYPLVCKCVWVQFGATQSEKGDRDAGAGDGHAGRHGRAGRRRIWSAHGRGGGGVGSGFPRSLASARATFRRPPLISLFAKKGFLSTVLSSASLQAEGGRGPRGVQQRGLRSAAGLAQNLHWTAPATIASLDIQIRGIRLGGPQQRRRARH